MQREYTTATLALPGGHGTLMGLVSPRGHLRLRGSSGLRAPSPAPNVGPSWALSTLRKDGQPLLAWAPRPSSARAPLRRHRPTSCPAINIHKSLYSLGHQARVELGSPVPTPVARWLSGAHRHPPPLPSVPLADGSQAAASWPRTRRNCWVLWPSSLTLSTMSWAAAGDGYWRAAALVVATMPRSRSHSRLL